MVQKIRYKYTSVVYHLLMQCSNELQIKNILKMNLRKLMVRLCIRFAQVLISVYNPLKTGHQLSNQGSTVHDLIDVCHR